MSDGEKIAGMLAIAGNPHLLLDHQHEAARKLMHATGIHYPHDGCAITLSCLLQAAGIEVADTYRAIDLGHVLEKRGWKRVAVGEQQAGDVGSTCGPVARHGIDHIYLVAKRVNDAGEMVVADNQSTHLHFRWTVGHGKSRTTHFLRAPASADSSAEALAKAEATAGKPQAG